jgi:ubiquinone/menaquinone biosynthesis C-methylase UbiE
MSVVSLEGGEFKSCCASFYADETVRRILGDSFHPGGEVLTRQLLRAVDVGPADRLLDLAAGQGTSAVLAAKETGCQVVAVDLSAENLERARAAAEQAGVADRVTVQRSDAERIDLPDGSFDVVLCECAFCTFVDKPTAAREMGRVLRPGGRLALSDMTLRAESFPPDLRTLLLRVACIADAVPAERMRALFEEAGFVGLRVEDVGWALEEMVQQIQKRLLAAELADRLGKLSLGGIDISEGKRLARRSLEIIRQGVVGYVTLTGER